MQTPLLTVHAGASEPLTDAQERSLLASQCAAYRAAMGQTYKEGKTLQNNCEIFDRAKRAPVTVVIRLARIRLLHVIANADSPPLHALLDELIAFGAGWACAIGDDCKWAHAMLGRKSPDSLTGNLVDWIAEARTVTPQN